MSGTNSHPKNALNDDTIVRRGSDQLSCDLDGEVAILQVATGQYYGLNEVGAHVWQLLEQAVCVREIHRALLEEFDVESDRCRADLEVLLSEMADSGLVEFGNELGG